jgi:NADH dehydrogenase (ubiquinone) 1 alpha subcomplex subunit 5
MEIEPFPRARIMKICYHILERIRQIPEEAMYRQYTEEKAKCIMTVVDETEDIQ